MIVPHHERILVTVKTYPTLSTTYGETVCTAGVREDGSWIRLYPVPFRRLEDNQQYNKFDWIDCQVIRHALDPRPESYRPVDPTELEPESHVGTTNLWRERRRIVLENGQVYYRLDEIIQAAKDNAMSLCVFKPNEIIDLVIEPDERDWERAKMRAMREFKAQAHMFEDNSWRESFEVIPKLPYSFAYRFSDSVGKVSQLQIIDWEIGALFWNCVREYGDEEVACQKVRQKYIDQFADKDVHLFLGTTQQWHFVGTNPYLIVGVFPIPHDSQMGLL